MRTPLQTCTPWGSTWLRLGEELVDRNARAPHGAKRESFTVPRDAHHAIAPRAWIGAAEHLHLVVAQVH